MTTPGNSICVLIIEDDEEDYMLAREYLREADGTRFTISWAKTLQSGIDILSEETIDAVLLDLSLADSQGMDTFGQLRRRFPHLPVIILTGFADENVGTRAVHEGAQDYIIKQNLDSALLDHALRYAIERKKISDQLREYADELRRYNNEITENLRLARKVQQRLLPQESPGFPRSANLENKTLTFSHLYRPSTIMSGDFFDILQISDTKAGAFICDVMGHGMRAALITAVVRGLAEELRHLADNPDRFLTEMNRSLVSILQSPGELIFISALYIVVDAETGMARYAVAGHPPPVCGSRDKAEVCFLATEQSSCGPALGVFADEPYEEQQCQLAPDDLLVCFTDGIYEVLDKSGEEYGSGRVIESVRRHIHQPLDKLLGSMVTDVESFSEAGDANLDDDICLLGFSFHGQRNDSHKRSSD